MHLERVAIPKSKEMLNKVMEGGGKSQGCKRHLEGTLTVVKLGQSENQNN